MISIKNNQDKIFAVEANRAVEIQSNVPSLDRTNWLNPDEKLIIFGNRDVEITLHEDRIVIRVL